MASSLKELAAEREKRNRERGISTVPDPTPATNVKSSTSSNPRVRQVSATQPLNNLKYAHRSIRMGHSIGLIICVFSTFMILFPWVMRTQFLIVCIFLFGAWTARSGGVFVHSWLPATLKEGDMPTPAEIESHDKNLFLPTLTGTLHCVLLDHDLIVASMRL